MPIINFLTSNNNNNRCCCNNYNNRSVIIQRQPNNIRQQNERIAQFISIGSTTVQSGEVIPLLSTQFNNISQSVALTPQGTIQISEQGVYLIEYNMVVSNPNAASVDVIIELIRNSLPPITLSKSVATVSSLGTTTISNSIINSVISGTMQEISLINSTTDEVLIISANVVVTKIT